MSFLPAPLILASTSPYRAALLRRLDLPFTQVAPGVDESARAAEAPDALVRRLALAKANAVAQQYPDAIVIGSDQMALARGELLGKTGSMEGARHQLRALSAQRVRFLTGLAVVHRAANRILQDTIPFEVRMRALSDAEITDYVQREMPVDAAGSFKSEGLGIALFESMHGEDPSALIGLPLIRLHQFLRECGCRVLG